MANKHTLISTEIHARVDAARIAQLATLEADKTPHAIPICFYSAIDRKPKQVAPTELTPLKNIRESPQVALLVDEYDEDWTRLWYVLVRGKAEVVSEPGRTAAGHSPLKSEVSAV